MITVFGSINVDLVTRVEAHPRPGETIAGSDYRLIPVAWAAQMRVSLLIAVTGYLISRNRAFNRR